MLKLNALIAITKKIIVLGSISLSASSISNAGETSVVGTAVFVCEESGTKKVFLADTYKYIHSLSSAERVNFEQLSTKTTLHSIFKIFERSGQSAKEIQSNFLGLLFETIDTYGQSLTLGVDDIDVIPAGCEKRQLSIQAFIDTRTLLKSTVYYDANLLNRLSHAEAALFKAHEALVKVYGGNTKAVRTAVETLAKSKSFLESAHLPWEPGNSLQISVPRMERVGKICNVRAQFRPTDTNTVCILYTLSNDHHMYAWIIKSDQSQAGLSILNSSCPLLYNEFIDFSTSFSPLSGDAERIFGNSFDERGDGTTSTGYYFDEPFFRLGKTDYPFALRNNDVRDVRSIPLDQLFHEHCSARPIYGVPDRN